MDTTIFARYEFKYLIPVSLVDPIRRFIQGHCTLDKHSDFHPDSFPSYVITSLYLDNHQYRTYWDNEDDNPNRFKLRIRTYGDKPDAPVNFEVKRRVHEAIVKSTAALPAGDWKRFLRCAGEQEIASLPAPHPTALETFLRLSLKIGASPKMLVRYERTAFQSAIDSYVRVTFDRRLAHQPMSNYTLQGDPTRWRPIDGAVSIGREESTVVLELKFVNRPPQWLAELVRRFELVRCGDSKYVRAVRASVFGLERERPWDRKPAWTLPMPARHSPMFPAAPLPAST